MYKLVLIMMLAAGQSFAQEKPRLATTDDGQRVILLADGTWKFAEPSSEAMTLKGFTEAQRTAFQSAVASLRKIDDGLSFGLSRREYLLRLGDAKSVIEDAANSIPAGKVRDSLLTAWAAHLKAARWWEILRDSAGLPLKSGEADEYKKELPKLKMARTDSIAREEILTACWLEASEALRPLLDFTKARP